MQPTCSSIEGSGNLTGPESSSVFIQDKGFKSFENSTTKLSAEEKNGLVRIQESASLIFKFQVKMWLRAR